MSFYPTIKTITDMKINAQSFLATLAFLALIVAACKKEDTPPDPVPPIIWVDTLTYTGPIRFDTMKIGQKSRYLGLLGDNYHANSNLFNYTTDTLQLQIIGHDANGYIIEERFRYTDPVSNWFNTEKDSVFRYYATVVDDTLRFKPLDSWYVRSRIVGYQISKDGIALEDISSPKIEIQGWKTNLGYCECRRTGYAEDYNLFGKNYAKLNVLIENSPMSFDGNGETYIYSKTAGIVRYSTYSWWTQNGYGWDLLP
jgi:hypothetical protein